MWCSENKLKGNAENEENILISQNDTGLERANTKFVQNQHEL